ncbi:hypothetical protein KAT08_01345 [Candidatus Babeliales bacterium]|nr:hypothetical protein [Candidatus Babeliales bacterium]
MHLNLTFFVQIVNFSITYLFLNKIMFRPILLFLKQKKEKEKSLQGKIAKKESDFLMLNKRKDEDLIKFRKNMKEQYIIAPVKLPSISSKVIGKVDKMKAKKLIHIVKDVLIKKVMHVN